MTKKKVIRNFGWENEFWSKKVIWNFFRKISGWIRERNDYWSPEAKSPPMGGDSSCVDKGEGILTSAESELKFCVYSRCFEYNLWTVNMCFIHIKHKRPTL